MKSEDSTDSTPIENTMRTLISFWLPLFLTACTCASEPAEGPKADEDLEAETRSSADNASEEANDDGTVGAPANLRASCLSVAWDRNGDSHEY